jgi:hypothetical protein
VAQQQGYEKYHSPVSASVVEAGADRGYDFTGAGDIYTIGDAQITRVDLHSTWAGEGAIIVYKILNGPLQGKYIYNAEDIAVRPGLAPGPTVYPAGTVIGRATGSGRAPGIEIGLADGPHGPTYTGHQYASTYGAVFERLLQQIWGTPVRFGSHPPASPGPGAGVVPGFGGSGASATGSGQAPAPSSSGGGSGPASWASAAGHAVASEANALAHDQWYPGGQQGFLGGAVDSIGRFFKFVTSWRFAELLGGFLLLLIGLALLGRQFGLNPAPQFLSAAVPGGTPPSPRPEPSGYTKGPSERAPGAAKMRTYNAERAQEDDFRARNPGYDEVPY